MARVTSAVLVSALTRQISAAGGNAAVLAKGDAHAGAIILICAEKGQISAIRERILGNDGAYEWRPIGPDPIENKAEIDNYLARRRQRDPDLWVVELDIANAERFAAETTGNA
jgi:hypothetical protein